MAVALDFAGARPGGAALAAAGVTSVGRYLATDWRGITANEFADYVAHGVSVWLIKENSARGMLNGRAQGVSDAQDAEAQMAAIGVTGAPVYCAVDFDAMTSQFPALDAYVDGFTSVLGLARTGIYAGLHYLNHAAGRATFFWKTASSSFDHGEAAAVQLHLIQTTDAPPIGGTDMNTIVQQYHGQVTGAGVADLGATLIPVIVATTPPPPTQEEIDDMTATKEASIVRNYEAEARGEVATALIYPGGTLVLLNKTEDVDNACVAHVQVYGITATNPALTSVRDKYGSQVNDAQWKAFLATFPGTKIGF